MRKAILVRLLDINADAWNKDVFTDDIGNAFIQSSTKIFIVGFEMILEI